MLRNDAAIVVLSGGQDSTTCLAWALDRYEHVGTLGFDYGQRHAVELQCRTRILDALPRLRPEWGPRLDLGDSVLDLRLLREIGGTAMIDAVKIEMGRNGLPNTFVPGRNLLFLTAAAAYAYRKGARHVVTGVCETDYSGYPDCRDDTIKALQVAVNLGMEARFVLNTPLMWVDKKGTWELAERLGGAPLVDLVVRETHSCYEGDRSHLHEWGFGCGRCPACALRAHGYSEFLAGKAIGR
jgi:7-cyano-7-deazaguanine synthase